jgi:hypothetical protein
LCFQNLHINRGSWWSLQVPPSGGHVGSGLVQRLVVKICRTAAEENLWKFDD